MFFGSAPNESVNQRWGDVFAIVLRTSFQEIVRRYAFVEEVNVTNDEAVVLPQQACTVVATIVPHGTHSAGFEVILDGNSGGRCQGEVFLKPTARLGQRLYAEAAFVGKIADDGHLHGESVLHVVPAERVLLSGLNVVEGQAFALCHGGQEPFHPVAVAASGFLIDRLEGDDPLEVSVQSVVVLKHGVAAQHAEYGNRDLPLNGLCRHVGIQPAGVVSLVPVASPERISVCTILVLAVARGYDVITFVEIVERVCIDEPRPNGGRIGAKDAAELLHIRIHQSLPLLRRVASSESHICMPVPRESSAPFHAGIFHVRLRYLPPCSDLVSFGHGLFQKLLICWHDQSIVLNQESAVETIFIQLAELVGCSLEEVFVCEFLAPRLYATNEVDEIDDTGRRLLFICLNRHPTNTDEEERKDVDEKIQFHVH